MAFDEANDQNVMFSGYAPQGLNASTWLYDAATDTWSVQSGLGPTGRYGHAMAYMPSAGETFLTFGWDANQMNPGTTDEFWSYNLGTDTWTNRGSVGSAADRAYPGMVATNDKLIVFGGTRLNFGSTTQEFFGDTWVYDGAWTEVTPATSPSARYGHYMSYDSANDVVVLFGGYSATGFEGDTWIFNPNTNLWNPVTPTGTPPSARHGGNMVYHSARGESILYGGLDNTFFYKEDTWAYTYDAGGGAWVNLGISPGSASEPAFGVQQMMSYDSTNNVVVLFGGRVSFLVWNGTHELVSSYAPSGRYETDTHDFGAVVANYGTLTWSANVPANTDIQFQIAADDDGLGPWNFVGPDGTIGTYYTTSGTAITNLPAQQYIRVKAYLTTSDTAISPSLDIITVTYNMAPNMPALIYPVAPSNYANATPQFQWAFSDSDPGDTQAGFRVQADITPAMTPPLSCDSLNQVSTFEYWDSTCPPLADGIYYWTARTQDQDGAWSNYATSEMFIVDTIAPAFSNEDPADLAYTNKVQPDISVVITDAGAGVDDTSITMDVEGTLYTIMNPGLDYYWATSTLVFNSSNAVPSLSCTDGQVVNVVVYAEDNVSNSDTYSWSFTCDLTPPAFSNEVPADTAWATDAQQVITVDITDTLSGVDSSSLIMTVEGTPYDSTNLGMSWAAPTLTFNPATATPSQTFTDGQVVNVEAYAEDRATNSNTDIWSFTVDLVAPAFTNPSPTGFSKIPQFITVDISDTGSGIDQTTLVMNVKAVNFPETDPAVSWDGTTLTLDIAATTLSFTDGEDVNVVAYADDIAGNSNNNPWTFTIDESGPDTDVDYSTPNYIDTTTGKLYVSDLTDFTITADDGTGSGVDEIFYSIDNPPWTTYTVPFQISTEGAYTVSGYATDNLGNVGAQEDQDVIVDTTAPDTTIDVTVVVVGSSQFVGVNTEFTLTASDPDIGSDAGSGVMETIYKIDGPQPSSCGDGSGWLTYTAPFDLSAEVGGVHTIYFCSEDNVGNAEDVDSKVVSLDITNPEAKANVPTKVSVGDKVTFDGGTSEDNSGEISDYTWTITKPDNSEETLTGETADYTFSDSGTYKVVLTVTDPVGNTDSVEFTVTSEGGVDILWWIIIIVVIIVVVLLIVLYFLLRKKKPEEEELEEKPAPPKKAAGPPKGGAESKGTPPAKPPAKT